ncbi:MAG: hypothetical protein ACR2KO_08620 [Geodermatophilaceae bacterium]|jgi:hypothetical protein
MRHQTAGGCQTERIAHSRRESNDQLNQDPRCGDRIERTRQHHHGGTRIEVEFEVEFDINGQNWQVRLSDNGTRIFQGTRTTVGPSGSFEVRAVTANQAGPDNILGRARNPQTGETCVGRVTFP